MSNRRVEITWPCREDLCSDPALSILAALDATLALAVLSLAATHPCLGDHERPYYLPPLLPSDKVADDLIGIARELQHSLDEYRQAIIEENQADRDGSLYSDEFPF